MGLVGTPLGFFLMADGLASMRMADKGETRHLLKSITRILRTGIGFVMFGSPF